MSQGSLAKVTMTSLLLAAFLFPALSFGRSMPNEAVFVISTPPPRTNYTIPQRVTQTAKLTPVPPEIYSFRVNSDIRHRYSRTVVTSRVANKDFTRAQEVTFKVVLPEAAFISKFVMEIDNQTYEAYVKEKDEAREVYDQARNQSLSAALVSKNTGNSNLFTVNVNVKAESKVLFQLTYEELLSRTLGCYQKVIDIQPDHLFSIRDYQIVVNIQDTQKLAFVRVPRLDNDINVNATEEGNPDVVIKHLAPNNAIISWNPVTSVKKYLTMINNTGKFIVEYDVIRNGNAGNILMMQGYFVHFFAPKKLEPLKKHVVFVLDISGSMDGRKLAQLKESQVKILDYLSPDDYFNIITFSNDVSIWSPVSLATCGRKPNETSQVTLSFALGSASNLSTTTSQPLPATVWNISQAKKCIQKLKADGQTNIHKAIVDALKLIKSSRTTNNGTLLPDNIQSIIVFLTDGEPTVGITNLTEIQNKIKKENEILSVPIFSLAFGSGADFEFLKSLSLQNKAFARKIYETSTAALQLSNTTLHDFAEFYKIIASPLLSNVTFIYTSPVYTISDLTFNYFPNVFNGSEIVIAGKINTPPAMNTTAASIECELQQTGQSLLKMNVRGMGREGPIDVKYAESYTNPACAQFTQSSRNFTHQQVSTHSTEDSFLERLWAYLTIQQLTDMDIKGDKRLPLSLAINASHRGTPKQKAVLLALKYGFVSAYTSLVVVKPNNANMVADVKPSYSGSGGEISLQQPVPATGNTTMYSRVPTDSFTVPHSRYPTSRAEDFDSRIFEIELRSHDPSESPKPTTTPSPILSSTSRIPKAHLTLDDIVWLAKDEVFLYHMWTDYGISRTATFNDSEGAKCTNGTASYRGQCRHLQNCVLSEFVANKAVYLKSYFCEIETKSLDQYAGVCCPF